MSENTVEGESSTPQSTEAVETNIGELLDTDGLASQLERMFDAPDEPAAESAGKNEESPPVEDEPSGESEGEAESDLSQVEEEPSAEVEQADEVVEERTENPHKGLLKRIDKLTARRKEAEGRVDGLEEEIKDLRTELDNKDDLSDLPRVAKDNPYSHLKSMSAVTKEIEQAEEIM